MKEIVKKIGKDIWAYIIFIIAVTFVWNMVFDSLTGIKSEEKVSVFIGSQSSGFEKTDTLNDESRPEYLKIVEVNAYSVEDYMFSTILNVSGYEKGDILILPESLARDEVCTKYFAEISEAYQAQCQCCS